MTAPDKLVLEGKVECLGNSENGWGPNTAVVSVNFIEKEGMRYFPYIKFHGQNSTSYWGNCGVRWLRKQLKQKVNVGQRFSAYIENGRVTEYKAVDSE